MRRWIVGGPSNAYFNGIGITGCFSLSPGFAGSEANWIVGACIVI